jgi:hypothetical protein
MKHIKWYAIAVTALLLPASLFAFTKEEAVNAIKNAENLENRIKTDTALGPHVPYDLYSEAALNLSSARTMLDDRDYSEAYYFASMSAVRFETACLTAQARQARYQRLSLLGEQRGEDRKADDSTLGDSHMVKKGDVYHTWLYDWQLFIVKNRRVTYKLNPEAKEHLDSIVSLLQSYPGAKLKIVGHMAVPDYRDYSRKKAEIVARYFIEKKIPTERLEIIGVGNREVMETYVGYRRVSRVEFILTDVK